MTFQVNEYMCFKFRFLNSLKNGSLWKVCQKFTQGEDFHDCMTVKIFGVPRTAVFAIIDTIGFMVRL